MKQRARILIFNDGYDISDLEGIPHRGFEIVSRKEGSREELLALIGDFDAYICTLRIPVDAGILARAPRLRVLGTASTGTDHLDLRLLEQRGIAVLSLKNDLALLERISATAELGFGLVLACARHLPICFEASRDGRWERHNLAGRQLRGQVLGLIGLGRLGLMMARYGHAFHMQVIACDPYRKTWPRRVERVRLKTLLRRADFVSLHVHLNSKTRHLLGAKELAMFKPGAALINTARGGLVDETALIEEMKAGRIAAAGIDVIDGEWMPDKSKHPLIAYSRENHRLSITPHVGGTCRDAVVMTARHTFRKVLRHLRRRDP